MRWFVVFIILLCSCNRPADFSQKNKPDSSILSTHNGDTIKEGSSIILRIDKRIFLGMDEQEFYKAVKDSFYEVGVVPVKMYPKFNKKRQLYALHFLQNGLIWKLWIGNLYFIQEHLTKMNGEPNYINELADPKPGKSSCVASWKYGTRSATINIANEQTGLGIYCDLIDSSLKD